jgi:hypothetical protein
MTPNMWRPSARHGRASAIHVFDAKACRKDVDARHKAGHDDLWFK